MTYVFLAALYLLEQLQRTLTRGRKAGLRPAGDAPRRAATRE